MQTTECLSVSVKQQYIKNNNQLSQAVKINIRHANLSLWRIQHII